MNPAEFAHILTGLLADGGEREWVEFKENNKDPKDVGEYLSALANSAALCGQPFGYIVWGVNDTTRQVVGTSFRPRAEKIGNSELENWWATQLNPPVEFTIHEGERDGLPVVVFRVRAASHTPVRFQSEEHIRVGTYKKKLRDHPEHERRLWALFSKESFEDGTAASGLTADAALRSLDSQGYFRLLGQAVPTSPDAVVGRLLADKLILPDGGERYRVTNCGAILFASRLDDLGRLGRKALRVIRYAGPTRVQTLTEEPFGGGYAVEFERAMTYLKAVLPQTEKIGPALRRVEVSYPELAVRELLANTLIHQDFSMTGTGPMVEIFDGRGEFTNPGAPLIDTQRFIDHPPHSRNERLASLMRRMSLCEERGSGIDKVITAIEAEHLPPPEFAKTDSHTRVTLYARKPFGKMTKDERVRACYQHACLCRESGRAMTNASLRERFGLEAKNQSQASRALSDSLKAGFIKEFGQSSRSTRDKKYVPFWD